MTDGTLVTTRDGWGNHAIVLSNGLYLTTNSASVAMVSTVELPASQAVTRGSYRSGLVTPTNPYRPSGSRKEMLLFGARIGGSEDLLFGIVSSRAPIGTAYKQIIDNTHYLVVNPGSSFFITTLVIEE